MFVEPVMERELKDERGDEIIIQDIAVATAQAKKRVRRLWMRLVGRRVPTGIV